MKNPLSEIDCIRNDKTSMLQKYEGYATFLIRNPLIEWIYFTQEGSKSALDLNERVKAEMTCNEELQGIYRGLASTLQKELKANLALGGFAGK